MIWRLLCSAIASKSWVPNFYPQVNDMQSFVLCINISDDRRENIVLLKITRSWHKKRIRSQSRIQIQIECVSVTNALDCKHFKWIGSHRVEFHCEWKRISLLDLTLIGLLHLFWIIQLSDMFSNCNWHIHFSISALSKSVILKTIKCYKNISLFQSDILFSGNTHISKFGKSEPMQYICKSNLCGPPLHFWWNEPATRQSGWSIRTVNIDWVCECSH